MFTNYQKRFNFTTYGNNSLHTVTGFEQVVTNGIPTYFVLDYTYRRVIQYDQYWNYVKYNGLPYYSWNLKYVNGYFYLSSTYRIFTKLTAISTLLLLIIREFINTNQFIMIQFLHYSTFQVGLQVFQYLTQTVSSSDTRPWEVINPIFH